MSSDDKKVKIGKFAEMHGVSIDTVRHYMELGLIVPEKKGAHYYFNQQCHEDLSFSMKLKSLHFTLKEIHKIFFVYRGFSGIIDQANFVYKQLLEEKQSELQQQIQVLEDSKNKVEHELSTLDELDAERAHHVFGIHMQYLSLFCCGSCQGELTLMDGNIVKNELINGELRCNACGLTYIVDEGILILKNKKESKKLKVEGLLDADMNWTEIEMRYANNIYKNMQTLSNNMDIAYSNNKVILEMGSGFGIFLRNIYDQLPDDAVYVVVDHSLDIHRLVMKGLQSKKVKKNIIFICADFLSIPLRSKSIDVLIDDYGTTNYCIYKHNEQFPLHHMDKHMKPQAKLIGSYMIIDLYAKDSIIDVSKRPLFQQQYIKEQLAALGYETEHEHISSEFTLAEENVKDDSAFKAYGFIGTRK
ncbi:MerR family transcriptional regulator [Longirhabdus pacifica]|uniref:MerR family transcriptional regulator n=1 Tax=Longirhabdus pacifica TaxID=2305227 RepID=UPI0013E8CA69|nr:MerR family transcriptional regulator [Longirhabdus pacifica]